MKTTVTALSLLLLASLASATPPISGTYESTDLGGTMLPGRTTDSWAAPNQGVVGTTTNQLSWDGATLGTQWWFYCADVPAPAELILDTVDGNGNGTRRIRVTYQGGIVILDGIGPWGDGSEPSYTALNDSYVEIQTFEFQGFALVEASAVVSASGTFVGFTDSCFHMTMTRILEGTTNQDSKPLNYPDFLAPATCAPTRTLGAWARATEISLMITDCAVPTEATSWGTIKTRYE